MSGVVGIYSRNRNDVSQIAYYGLYALQHRGQVSSGIAVNNNGFVDYFKDLGLVNEVFSKESMERLIGNIGIGHVRYASQHEERNLNNAQPLVVGYKRGALALSLDGSIVNSTKLRDELEDKGSIFQTDLDAEVIANLIARYHKDNIEDAVIKATSIIDGSYGMVLMTPEKLIGARDPYGLKPLSLGRLGDDYILASETCAFDTIGADFVRDVEPGEIVTIDEKGINTILYKPMKRNHCLFELIYFARPDSYINGRSIYKSRIEAGRQLYRECITEADMVIGAPDSGIVAAIGYAEESNIPYEEGIIKNRYVGRTFIQPTQELREQGVRIKLNALKENINGKRVILVDDSIVRGTTIKRTVAMLKKAGAKEVHVRISSPPVINSCHLGMDTPTEENLIAANMTVERIREEIGANSLYYLSLDGLIRAAGQEGGFCKGCFTGEYAVRCPSHFTKSKERGA
ncbi:amidophosphoribosyltransferase [Schnuerera sp. xch1]|uniref:amidophosphoribosyltransferase n=1 Tax=Schnuerera sp. xch1 TaxID=2874283 RepID=UPI001CBBDEBA|nr:amidophosphoribosyltransferase [Schnuerera sp. xch1]MBZ2175505.1 amidophosphoribosyltransferase [Schnuerera sp. xch1]